MRTVANFDLLPFSAMKIALLAGGNSPERDVSLESGSEVGAALSGRGHQVTPIDPLQTDLNGVPWDEFDAVFIALHGTFGEDGQVQRILEDARVPFTGSDSQTSRLAFSKSASKERFATCGVPTLPYVLIHESDAAARISQQAGAIGFPCVVKPDGQGSSLGVSLVQTPEQLPAALSQCFHFDPFGIVEAYIDGSE